MKPTVYDLRLIETVTAFRVIAREKQSNIAQALRITQPEYSRIEKGERALTAGHLFIVCSYLNLPVSHVVKFAELSLPLKFDSPSEKVLLLQLAALVESSGLSSTFGRHECQHIIMVIREKKISRDDALT